MLDEKNKTRFPGFILFFFPGCRSFPSSLDVLLLSLSALVVKLDGLFFDVFLKRDGRGLVCVCLCDCGRPSAFCLCASCMVVDRINGRQ